MKQKPPENLETQLPLESLIGKKLTGVIEEEDHLILYFNEGIYRVDFYGDLLSLHVLRAPKNSRYVRNVR